MTEKEEDSEGESEEEAPVSETSDPKYQCRLYESEFPEVGEIVMVKYLQAEETWAKVALVEYNMIEGMIIAKELTRRRTSNVSRHIRVGKKEPAVVLKVDKKQGRSPPVIFVGYMDLSKIQVKGADPQKCEERYKKANIVHTIIRRVAINCDEALLDLYRTIIWPLNKQEGGALAAFKLAAEYGLN